jgi:hypothetical protein
MQIGVNYKLLDLDNKEVSLVDQMVTIFDRLYGGNISEEISDTVGLLAQSTILEVISKYNSNSFYENRRGIQWDIFLTMKNELKSIFVTVTYRPLIQLCTNRQHGVRFPLSKLHRTNLR